MLNRPMLSFDASDDVSLCYQVDDFTNPWQPPETLILIHAAMGSSRRMHLWVPHLSREFKVVRPDMRGHGQSLIGPEEALSLERLTSDLVELMDHLGVDRAHLAGSSAGGIVAMNTAMKHPDRVRSLSAFATLPGLKVSAGHTQYGSWVDRIGIDGIAGFLRKTIGDRFDVETVDPGFIDWFIEESSRNDPESLRRFVPVMAAADISENLREIRCPTLCVVPGSDPIHTPEQYALLKEGITNCRFVTYDVSGHNITDAYPDRCAEDLAAFLRDIRA